MEPQTKYTLIGTDGGNDPDTGDIYRGIDRFGRIKDSLWYDDGSSTDSDRIKYGYDRVGNCIYRENAVATAAGERFDEHYSYDLIHRLKHIDRGTLNVSKTGMSSATFRQCWTLDETGNWAGFRQDDTGNGTWDLIQSRTSNIVNETTDIAATSGATWITPEYSRAGNMTAVPQPFHPTAPFTAIYDAWQRLVRLVETLTSKTISEYEYDGANRRIIQKSFARGIPTDTRHLYYTKPSAWQAIEERLGIIPDSTAPDRQFIWGLRYIDDCILRDRDTDDDGTLDERLYVLQDAHWNVTAMINLSGIVQERLAYTAYGKPLVLAADWAPQADQFSWETQYAGYRIESSTGLFHVRNRVFHIELGAWLQRDPLGQAAGINVYEYAKSAPLVYLDPSGTFLAETGIAWWLIFAPLAPLAPVAPIVIVSPLVTPTSTLIAAPAWVPIVETTAAATTGSAAGATSIGLVPGIGIAAVGGIGAGLAIDQVTNPYLAPVYASVFDYLFYDPAWDTPIIAGIGGIGGGSRWRGQWKNV
jgi:RHS repeat-associated protein